MNPISSPWPFAQWGLDILGPFPRATGNRRFVLVTDDYFTKWAEAEAQANIQDVDVKKFVWKNIITKFGVPNSLISDNGLQFDSRAFCEFCSNLGIRNRYSSPMYPQGNGQAEAVNKVIVNDLKRRLEGAKGNWGETTQCFVGIPDNSLEVYKGDLILSHVRGEGRDTSRG